MERLTYRSTKFNNPVSYGACEKIKCSAKCDSCKINDLIVKLCAYEDTGLEPEQVMELKSFTQGGIHCSGTSLYVRPEDIGKTVFLTREEAEAALFGGNHGKENP